MKLRIKKILLYIMSYSKNKGELNNDSWTDIGTEPILDKRKTAQYLRVLKSATVPGPSKATGKNTRKKRKMSPPKDNSNQLSQGNDLFNELINEIKGLRSDIHVIKTKLTSIETTLTTFDTRLMALENENKLLRDELLIKDKQMTEFRYDIDSIEQKSKQFEVIISSPEIASLNEAVFKDEMIELAKKKLKLSENFLSRFSFRRIGKDGDWRALLTASNIENRNELLKTAKTVRPLNFYVSECLIKARQELYYNARKFKKDNNLELSIYTYYGEIFVKRNKTDKPRKVKSKLDIQNLGVTA